MVSPVARGPRAVAVLALLPRSLGILPLISQALAGIGLTITAVLNIPVVASTAGGSTWICYLVASLAIVLVTETFLIFRHRPVEADGVAGFVLQGLGPRWGAFAAWLLWLGYGTGALCCLAVFGQYLDGLARHLGTSIAPALGFAVGAGGCLLLARRDVRFSSLVMLATEAVSTVIILSLAAMTLAHGRGGPAMAPGLLPLPSPTQLSSGLVIAVLSFAGFESATTLGREALDPDRSLPIALRRAVLVAAVLFLFWSIALVPGIEGLDAAVRFTPAALPLLADQLGWPGAGRMIEVGAFLCFFGSSLALLSGLGRVTLALAERRLFPRRLAAIHPRFRTPSAAITAGSAITVVVGLLLAQSGLSPDRIYDQGGGFAALCFLGVYLLVALAAWFEGQGRQRLVASGTGLVLAAILLSFLWSAIGSQPELLIWFTAAVVGGALLVRFRSLGRPRL